MEAAADIPGPAQPLSDLLEQLPLDVVESNVWEQLSTDKAAKSSLRLTSLPCRLLADLLCTSVKLRDSHQRGHNPHHLTEDEVEPWIQAVQGRAAYLARLPRLTSLQLIHWPNEAALTALLSEYGAATGGRLTKLALRSGRSWGPPLTLASVCAIPPACPSLTELDLCCEDAMDPSADAVLGGDLLHPLQDVPLSLLVLSGNWTLGPDSLRSLGALPHLRHLGLRLAHVLPQHLLPLAALSNLRPMRSLSRLTSLQLPGLDYDGTLAAADGAAAVAADEGLAAGVAVLGCLKQLEHLARSEDCVVDDLVFSALRQLTKLTWLKVAHIDLTHPTPGHLPLLRHLHLLRRLQPSLLLRTLLPLLPLPALELLHPEHESLELTATSGAGDAARQAADLFTSCQHLAAAPHLTLRNLGLHFKSDAGGQVPIPCLALVEGLQPLAHHLTLLRFEDRATVGADFGVLSASLPRVRALYLIACGLTDGALPAVLSHWPSLWRVSLVDVGAGVTGEGWLALAAVRGEPLWVEVEPALPEEQVLQCQALQAHLFGTQNLMFGRAPAEKEEQTVRW